MAHRAFRVDRPHVLANVASQRMIRFMHRQSFAIVIHSDIRAPPKRNPNACRCTAAACERVDDQLMKIELETASVCAQGLALNDVELLSRLAITIRMPNPAFVFSCAYVTDI